MSYVCAYSSVQLDKRRVGKEFTVMIVWRLSELFCVPEYMNKEKAVRHVPEGLYV